MTCCERCGNDYDRVFTVTTADGAEHVFDSYECAINALAPRCEHCGNLVLGHGVEAGGSIFCCAHCARSRGRVDLRDRSSSEVASEFVAASGEIPEAAAAQRETARRQRAGAVGSSDRRDG